MKIGLFGGTFDPIHIAHLILADESYSQLSLSRVFFILTPHPPHKENKNITKIEQRFDMLLAAITDNPHFFLSKVDIQRPPPHYAVDTVKIIKNEFPDESICYIMGGDSLHDLPTWHEPQKFIAHCDTIAVMRRPNDQIELKSLEKFLPGIMRKITFVKGPLLDISGTKIRNYIQNSGPYRYYLPESVYRIIEEYQYYRL